MGSRRSFHRKLAYIAAISVLLMFIFGLSRPATSAGKGEQGSPGGKLARLRTEYNLSPSQFGEVDPTSVTIKLAALGLRGVAVNMLWTSAIDFKLKKDWTHYRATLNQITKVQPNFINVWIHLAWNLSYNVSVEFDDYRERYRWVIKGIDFLIGSLKYNEHEPRLQREIGWMISQKIGKSDEAKQFRRLFKADDDFNANRPVMLRDNWLVGKEWFERVVEMADKGMNVKGMSSVLYRSNGPMCQMCYSEAIEKDGTFGEVARSAWATAAGDWHRYGAKDIATTFSDETSNEPIAVRLNDAELHDENARKLAAQLDAIEPGLRAKIAGERRDALTPSQRAALDTPIAERTGRDFQLAEQAELAVKVTHDDVAKRIKGPERAEAKRLAKEAQREESIAYDTRHYRGIVNFDFWRLLAQVEQTDLMIKTRQLLYQGDRAHADGDLIAAREFYEQGIDGWRRVLEKYPGLVSDQTTQESLENTVTRYRRILNQLDEPFPENFVLNRFLEDDNPAATAPKAPPKADGGKKESKSAPKKSENPEPKPKEDARADKGAKETPAAAK
jgi:hypothetical protein